MSFFFLELTLLRIVRLFCCVARQQGPNLCLYPIHHTVPALPTTECRIVANDWTGKISNFSLFRVVRVHTRNSSFRRCPQHLHVRTLEACELRMLVGLRRLPIGRLWVFLSIAFTISWGFHRSPLATTHCLQRQGKGAYVVVT